MLLPASMPAAKTSSRKISSLHPLVKVLHNYTATNPQAIHGRENGCDTCSSNTLARQMRALKNWCCQQLLKVRIIRNRGTAQGILQPVPWQDAPFHTWLLYCLPETPGTELCMHIHEPPGTGTDTSSRTNTYPPWRSSCLVALCHVQRQVLEVARL